MTVAKTNEEYYREQRRRLDKLFTDLSATSDEKRSQKMTDAKLRHELASIIWDVENGRQP